MWQANSRHSFLSQTCPQVPRSVVHSSLFEVLMRFRRDAKKAQQIHTVKSFEQYEEAVRVGYGDIGIEILVSIIEFLAWRK